MSRRFNTLMFGEPDAVESELLARPPTPEEAAAALINLARRVARLEDLGD